jgi:hypothetical protein
MAGPRYVAISKDLNDRTIYAGPNPEALPAPPAGRQWMEEYRALSGGYEKPDGYRPEEWACTGPDAPHQPPAVAVIRDRLATHLALSSTFLRNLPENPTNGTITPDLAKLIVRHEKALNLMLRVMLEVFDVEPPAWVMRETQ